MSETTNIETKSQRKKRLAREFNERKEKEQEERKQRVLARIAYENSPAGKRAAREARLKIAMMLSLTSATFNGGAK